MYMTASHHAQLMDQSQSLDVYLIWFIVLAHICKLDAVTLFELEAATRQNNRV